MLGILKKIFGSSVDDDRLVDVPPEYDELNEIDKEIRKIEERVPEEEMDEDTGQERKKTKQFWKKKKKLETKTVEDLQEERKAVYVKMLRRGILFSILFMLILAAIIVAFKDRSKERYVSKEKKEPEIVLSTGEDKLWKISVDNRIVTLKKNIQELEESTKKELNETKVTLRQGMSKISEQLQKSNEEIQRLLAQNQQYTLQKLEETKRELKHYTDKKVSIMANALDKRLNEKSQKTYEAPAAIRPDALKLPPPPELDTGVRKGQSKKSNLAALPALPTDISKKKQQPKENNETKFEEEIAQVEVVAIDKDSEIDYTAALSLQEQNKSEPPKLHLMTGMVKATLITGVSAPTFSSGKMEPKPVLLSIDSEMVIANEDIEDIEDCFLIGKATGNMNSERAEILVSRLSCSITDKDGNKYRIEEQTPAMGWVIGEDGKYGLKGRLVDSAGKVVMRELLVGFLQGVATAFSPGYVGGGYYGIGAAGGIQNNIGGATIANGAQNGISMGMNSALNSLAQYYKKMLDGVYPVIDVKAGRKVTVLFKGFQDVKKVPYKTVSVNEYDDDGYEEVEIDYQDF